MGGARYLVSGLDKDELRKHINHQVEIQGRLEGGHGTGMSTTSGSTGSGAGSTPASGGTSSSGATSGAGSTAGSSGSTGSTGRTGTAVQGTEGHGGMSASGAMRDLPKLNGSSIRMISASCSASGSQQ
jgi:hypothetical protein